MFKLLSRLFFYFFWTFFGCLDFQPSVLSSLCLYYNRCLKVCQGVFSIFYDFSLVPRGVHSVTPLPLTLIIIADYTENAIYKLHKDNIKTLYNLTLDINLFGRSAQFQDRWPATEKEGVLLPPTNKFYILYKLSLCKLRTLLPQLPQAR